MTLRNLKFITTYKRGNMKKLFLLALIGAFFIAANAEAQQGDVSNSTMDPKAATYYNSAIQFMKSGQYENALTSLDSSLMIAKDYRMYYMQGQANLKLGKTAEALTSFGESVKLNPEYDMGYMAIGNTHLALKEYEQAINDFKKVTEVTKDASTKEKAEESIKFSTNAQSIEFYNKGNELSKQSNFEEAIKNYDLALSISKDPKYYYQKSLALSKLSKTKEAEDALNAAVALDETFDLGYVALANIQTTNKDYAGAVKNYEKALAVTKNDNLKTNIPDYISKTYLVAGNNSYKDKKYDQSIEWMQKSVSTSPSDAAYLGLVKAFIEKKKYADALTSLDSVKALQKTVKDEAIAYYKGMVHLNKGEDSKAIENFTIALNDPSYKKASQSQIDYIKAKQKGNKK